MRSSVCELPFKLVLEALLAHGSHDLCHKARRNERHHFTFIVSVQVIETLCDALNDFYDGFSPVGARSHDRVTF